MTYHAYSYYDPLAEAWTLPVFAQLTDTQMVEMITRQARLGKVQDVIQDSCLYEVGLFDDNNGVLTAYEKPLFKLDIAKLRADIAAIRSLETKKDGKQQG